MTQLVHVSFVVLKYFSLLRVESLIINDVMRIISGFYGICTHLLWFALLLGFSIVWIYESSNADEPKKYSICGKNIKLPCDTANALGGTILYRKVIDSAINGSGTLIKYYYMISNCSKFGFIFCIRIRLVKRSWPDLTWPLSDLILFFECFDLNDTYSRNRFILSIPLLLIITG